MKPDSHVRSSILLMATAIGLSIVAWAITPPVPGASGDAPSARAASHRVAGGTAAGGM